MSTSTTAPEPRACYLVRSDGERLPVSPDDAISVIESGRERVWYRLRSPCDSDGSEYASLVTIFDYRPEPNSIYLAQGYQSWSFSGIRRVGETVERPGADMAALAHFSHLEPPLGPSSLESEYFVVFGDLAGLVLRCDRFGACFFEHDGCLAVSVDISRARLREGEELDVLAFACVPPEAPEARLEAAWALLQSSGLSKRARVQSATTTGWCSWYQYFHSVDEKAFLSNLRIASEKLGFLDVFQLDDGYQSAIGDWLETNGKFPSGLEAIAKRVAEEGFLPGIWIAPFLATTNSSLWEKHRDWFLALPNASPVPAMLNPAWGGNGLAYSLDCTNPEVLGWLEELGSTLREWGFRYVKIDFCYAAAMRGRSTEPVGRLEALRKGLSALRRGLGEDVFLLGCGMPLWPAVGIVDGMRIGPDVAPFLFPEAEIYGLTNSLPAVSNAWRNTIAAALTHRSLWLADPDCVMLRRRETKLDEKTARAWAERVASFGHMLLFSDDLSLYAPEDFELAHRLVETARASDRPPGVPPVHLDPLDPASYAIPTGGAIEG
jgi:hypothetical protein